jgi:hypothetical protein
MDMPTIRAGMGGRSMRSLFRDLSMLDYLSSFTHRGQYYTLADIPDFDEHGLWFYQGVGFSRAGTLKETVAVLVETAQAGRTHLELEAMVRVRAHNTLLLLVEQDRLARERIGRCFTYMSAEAGRRAEQVACRHALLAEVAPAALPTELVIAVLVEALQASEGLAPPAVVAARLTARGEAATSEQVARVYAENMLVTGKKTAVPPSGPSRS